jgi:hypothetical protein
VKWGRDSLKKLGLRSALIVYLICCLVYPQISRVTGASSRSASSIIGRNTAVLSLSSTFGPFQSSIVPDRPFNLRLFPSLEDKKISRYNRFVCENFGFIQVFHQYFRLYLMFSVGL